LSGLFFSQKTRRASIVLTSGAPNLGGFPARLSGRKPGAVMGTGGARRPWNFTKAASGADSRAIKIYKNVDK